MQFQRPYARNSIKGSRSGSKKILAEGNEETDVL